MGLEAERSEQVATVLEAVTGLSRTIAVERRAPFSGRSLSSTQMQVLFILAHDRQAVTPKRLATALGVTAGAVTQLVDGMRAEQLVQVSANPLDARSRVIRLTASASAEINSFERDMVRRLLPLFDDLSDKELWILAGLLSRVGETPPESPRT